LPRRRDRAGSPSRHVPSISASERLTTICGHHPKALHFVQIAAECLFSRGKCQGAGPSQLRHHDHPSIGSSAMKDMLGAFSTDASYSIPRMLAGLGLAPQIAATQASCARSSLPHAHLRPRRRTGRQPGPSGLPPFSCLPRVWRKDQR
jgi:hypothetical protein